MEHTTNRRIDRRQRKSRDSIQMALLELLKEKPLDQITISELAVRADVNRKTFYNNYRNLQEVRDELHDLCFDQIFSLLDRNHMTLETSSPEEFFRSFFHGLRDNLEQCRLIFDSGEHLRLTTRLKEVIMPYLETQAAANEHPTEMLPYMVEYTVNGLSSIIDLWLHSSPMPAEEQMASLAASLIRASTAAFRS